MHRDLGPWDAMSVGMFLQTLLLALTERGLGSCVEVSVIGYPEIVRAELDIPEELSILSGLAVGYSDPDFAANKLKIGREPIGENAVFLDREHYFGRFIHAAARCKSIFGSAGIAEAVTETDWIEAASEHDWNRRCGPLGGQRRVTTPVATITPPDGGQNLLRARGGGRIVRLPSGIRS
jgi:hypothetical protein